MIAYYVILFIIGSAFGSFWTVLMSRWKEEKWGILFGRSECPHCQHILTWRELFPIFSWIFQKWKCMNCHTRISLFYPLSEIFMWVLFMIAGYANFRLWITYIDWNYLVLFFLFFVTGIYTLYDIRYMEIPDPIMVVWIYGIFILMLFSWISWINWFLFDESTYTDIFSYIHDHIQAAWILYTFFFLQIFIPGSLHLIQKKHYKTLGSLCVSYLIFPFTFFLKTKGNDEEELPSWIGGWDLRVALFIWISLGMIHSIASILFAYIVWSIYGVGIIIYCAIKKIKRPREIPFWPFLWIGYILAIIFHSEILWYFMSI